MSFFKSLKKIQFGKILGRIVKDEILPQLIADNTKVITQVQTSAARLNATVEEYLAIIGDPLLTERYHKAIGYK